MPKAPARHRLAPDIDMEIAAISEACAPQGMTVEAADWRRMTDQEGFDAALALGVWDYQDRPDDLLGLLAASEARGAPVFNPAGILRWNIRKTYLRDLEEQGVAIVPTVWAESPSAADVEEAFERFGCDAVVLKRQVGAGAHGQSRIVRGQPLAEGKLLDRPGMIQPFLPAIEMEGEFSFFFIDGTFCHAVQKQAAAGDYRIQPTYGGVARAIVPEEIDLAAAVSVFSSIRGDPLYARVDMVRGPDGRLLLMELELIEPLLFPRAGEQVAERIGDLFARGLAKRLGRD